MAQLNEQAANSLCALASGIALFAGAGAVTFVAATAQALLGGVGFLQSIRQQRRADARRVFKQIANEVARVLQVEASGWASPSDVAAALEAFNRVMPQCLPTPEDVIGVQMDMNALSELLLARAARIEPTFARDGLNSAGPQLFRLIVQSAWNALRATSDYYEQIRSWVDEATLATTRKLIDASTRIELSLEEQQATLVQILNAVSADKGVPAAPLQRILERMGEAAVPIEQIIPRLEAKADQLLSLQRRMEMQAEARTTDIRGVEYLYEGQFEAATLLLEQSRLDYPLDDFTVRRTNATLLYSEASIDRLMMRYRAAADKFAQAATLVDFDAVEWSGYVQDRAIALKELGVEFGDRDALREAIGMLDDALKSDRSTERLIRAALQIQLAEALFLLGQIRATNTELQRAATLIHSSLNVFAITGSWRDWRAAKLLQARVFRSIGQREARGASLAKAEAAYGELLTDDVRDQSPSTWNAARIGLATVVLDIRKVDQGGVRAEDAIDVLRKAIASCDANHDRLTWASLHFELGKALSEAGQRTDDRDRLDEALRTFQVALEHITPQSRPGLWANLMNGVGGVLLHKGERKRTTDDLWRAVAAFQMAQEQQDRIADDVDWAVSQNNLGCALSMIATRENNLDLFERAAAAFRIAVKMSPRRTMHPAWRVRSNNLANALRKLGAGRGDQGLLLESIVLLSNVLRASSRVFSPFEWANIQENLAWALLALGEIRRSRSELEAAANAFTLAINVYEKLGSTFYLTNSVDGLRQARSQIEIIPPTRNLRS